MANTPASPHPPAGTPGHGERPIEHLYVVQLDGDPSACRGRVEHVISGRKQAFGDPAALLLALGMPADAGSTPREPAP